MARKIFDFPKPIVAAVNGLAIGGGITMLLIGADLIYASDNAYLGFYFIQNVSKEWPISKTGVEYLFIFALL